MSVLDSDSNTLTTSIEDCDSLVVGRARSISALSIGTTRRRAQHERGSKPGLDCSQWISR